MGSENSYRGKRRAGALELRRKGEARRRRRREKGRVCFTESLTGPLVLRVFIWRSQGRIPIKYSSAF